MFLLDKPFEPCSHKMFALMCFLFVSRGTKVFDVELVHRRVFELWPYIFLLKYVDDLSNIYLIIGNI